jgi:GT2 family glycosyltransferase
MFSIIIVHWNTPDLLAGCLGSVIQEAAESGLVAEIIVVDCHSSDDAYRGAIPRHAAIRLIELAENRGYAAGCNAGAAAASQDVLLFLNADVELLPGSVAALGRALELSPHIGLVAPLLLNPDSSLQSSGYRFPGIANVVCDLFPVGAMIWSSRLNGRIPPGSGELPYSVDYPLGAALALKRSAFDVAGGFDESYGMYCEEIDLCRRLEAAGWTRLIAPLARATHFSGASTSQQPVEMRAALWRSRARYHRRWDSDRKNVALRATVIASALAAMVRARPGERETAWAIRRAYDAGAAP